MNIDRPFALSAIAYICIGWLLLEAAAWNRRRAARARIGRERYAARCREMDAHVQDALDLAAEPPCDTYYSPPLPAVGPHTAELIARMSAARIDQEWLALNGGDQ